MGVRGITICVDYAPLLAMTLRANMRHFAECLVVTSPEDRLTQELAGSIPNVRLHVTDAFTRHGAKFNKGLAMEEGFDVLGREGCILIWDADILLPDRIPLEMCRPDFLHGARRRIVKDPLAYNPEAPWRTYPYAQDGGPIGFFQLFHAEDTAVFGRRPWYNVNYPHAGGSDAQFLEHWSNAKRVVLPCDCLHFGEPDRNWFGTDALGRDMMSVYAHRMEWRRALKHADPTAVQRVEHLPERVDVPGYPTSEYRMPFERRAENAKPKE